LKGELNPFYYKMYSGQNASKELALQ